MKEVVCPNCGSKHIEYASMTFGSTKTIAGLGIPEMYFCPNCGYEGSVIMEIDQKHLKKVHFPKNKPTYFKADKQSADILRPIFTIVILAFLFITVFGFIGGTQTSYYTEDLKQLPADYMAGKQVTDFQIAEMPQFKGTVLVEKVNTGETIIEVKEKTPPELNLNLGIEPVIDTFFPIFVLLFSIGFVGLMIAKHYERSLKFI